MPDLSARMIAGQESGYTLQKKLRPQINEGAGQ
jgi:hypothetical protein